MTDDPSHLAAESGFLGYAQAFDLFGEILPIEDSIRSAARQRSQGLGLVFDQARKSVS